jgi:outer membrane protein assembly factor BamB
VKWTFFDETGFTAGPAISMDGSLYITSTSGRLYALDPDGEVLWQTILAHIPVGAPGLNAEGKIFVTDQEGGLTKLNESGEADWYYRAEPAAAATSGPVIDSQGMSITFEVNKSRPYLLMVRPYGFLNRTLIHLKPRWSG